MYGPDNMVIFGGGIGAESGSGDQTSATYLLALNLRNLSWSASTEISPLSGFGLFGHSCTMIDSKRLIVMGGVQARTQRTHFAADTCM